MLLGEYEYRIDQKGRVAIPVKLRKEFPDGLFITKAFDKCMVAYPTTEWNKIADRFSSLPDNLGKNRQLIRHTIGSAFHLELDSQGRIALPAPLRQYAQVKDAVVMSGGIRYLEIWSKELWEAEQSLIEDQVWQLAEGMDLR